MTTFVAKVSGTDESGSTVASLSASASLTVNVGDVVDVFVKFECATGVAAITPSMASGSNGGNTFAQVRRHNHSVQTDLGGIIMRSFITNAGTFTPTVSFTGGTVNYVRLDAVQWRPASGFDLAADVSSDSEANTGVTLTAGSISSTGDGGTFMGGAGYALLTWTAAAGGWTLVRGTAGETADAQYKVRSGSASENPALTIDASSPWLAILASVKEVAQAPPAAVDSTVPGIGDKRLRPGRGPYSKNRVNRAYKKSSMFGTYTEPVVDPPKVLADIGDDRPRVGRGPYSLGRYFRPKVEAFTPGSQTYSQNQSATLSFVGTLQKQVNRALAGSITPAATLTTSSVRLAVLTAALSFVGTIQKTTTKITSGSLSFAGGLVKSTKKLHSAVLTFNGALSTGGTLFSQNLSAALSFTGTLVKQTGKVLAGAISPTGAIVKQTKKLHSATLSFVGTLTNQTKKLHAATLSFTGTLATSWRRSVVLSAALSFAGAVTSQFVIITNTIADMWRKAWTGIWRDINQPKDGP